MSIIFHKQLFPYARNFQCIPGGKIIEHFSLESEDIEAVENGVHPLEVASELNEPIQRIRSPSPELGFTPLSPPPWHLKSRKPDAMVFTEDDPSDEATDCHGCVPLIYLIVSSMLITT